MKRIAIFCLGVFCLTGLQAQKLYPLRFITDSLVFRTGVENRQLVLEWQAPPEVLHVRRGDFPVINSVALQEGDLVLQYTPGKARNSMSYSVNIALRTPEGDSILPASYERLETGQDGEVRQLVWLDFTEQLPDLQGVYTLFMQRALMGAVHCEGARPAFTLQKQLPHFAGGVAGVALIGLGQVYNRQKKDAYTQYRNAWADGQPRSEADDPFFQTAQDKRKAARICTYTGWALLGADAIWYALRWRKFRKQQENYDKFCAGNALSSLQLHPVILPHSPVPGLGISFTLSNGRP